MQATIATLSIDLLCKQCYKASMLHLGASSWKNSPIYWLVLNSESAPTRTGCKSSKRNVVVWTTKSPRSRNTWSWQKRSIALKPTKPSSPVSPVNSIPTKKVLVSDRIQMSPTSRGKYSWGGASIPGKACRKPRTKCSARRIARCTQACAAIGRGGAPDQGKNAADIRGHILEAGQAVQESGSEYVRGIGRIPVPRSVVCPGWVDLKIHEGG